MTTGGSTSTGVRTSGGYALETSTAGRRIRDGAVADPGVADLRAHTSRSGAGRDPLGRASSAARVSNGSAPATSPADIYLGLLQLACALICQRRLARPF
jgi:hypothetical protein